MTTLTRAPFVLCHPADQFGCFYHRIGRRMDLLGRAGLVTGRIDMQLFDETMIKAMHPDVIVFQRQHEPHQREAVLRYRECLPDAHFVYEIDDALSAVPDKSPHKPHIGSDIDDNIAATATLCDSMTTTTKALANHMRGIVGDMDIRIAPNMLGRDDFTNAAKMRSETFAPGRKPRVGWGGSMSHTGDLELLHYVIAKTYNRIEWVFLGTRPKIDVPIEFHEGVQPKDYLVKLASLNLDLVVAPLEENLFNRCKSNLRLLECGACYYPVIASPVEPYLEGSPPVVSYAKPTTESWLNAINAFLALPLEKQKTHGRKLHDWAERHFCFDDKAIENVKFWLPKDTKPFVPSREDSDGSIVIASSNPGYTALGHPVTSFAEALASKSDVLFLREGTGVTSEQVERMAKRLNETQASTISAISNGGGLCSFPKKESLMPCDERLGTLFDTQLQAFPPSDVDILHPTGPAVLLSRRALNFCGLPNIVESDDETAVIEWGLSTTIRGFRNKVATDCFVIVDRVYQPPDIELVTRRIQTRWPLNAAEQDPLMTLRAHLEIDFYKHNFQGTLTKNASDYQEWHETFDTIGHRDVAALAQTQLPIKLAVIGDAQVEGQSHIDYEHVKPEDIPDRTDWVVFVRDNAILRSHALSLIAGTATAQQSAWLIYGDHDTITSGVRSAHDFKPNFDLDMLLSRDYITPIFAIKATHLDSLKSTSETALYTRVLEAIAKHGREGVVHIPKILAHLAPITQTRQFGIVNQKARVANELAPKFGINASITPARAFPGVANITFGTKPFEQPKVTIVVPCKDRHDMLQPCIDSILHYTEYKNYEVLIVDNGSTRDKMLAYQATLRDNPRIKITSWPEKYNWAALNNWAATQCDSEYLLFLNDDTRIKMHDWLTNMMSCGMRHSVGAVGAKLMYPYSAIQHVGVVCDGGLTGHIQKMVADGEPGYNGFSYVTHEATAVTGACLLVARRKFAEVGGFDEAMPLNFNDVAFCTDLIKKGYKNVVVSSAVVEHIEGATRPTTTDETGSATMREEAEVLREHWPNADPYWNYNFMFQHSLDGTRVSGMDFDLFNCTFQTPWRGKDWARERVLVIGDDGPLIRRIASTGDTPFGSAVSDLRLYITNPPLQNIPPIDLRNAADMESFLKEMGITRIALRSIEGLQAEVLGLLMTVPVETTYRPRNVEAICPRLDFTVKGVDCGQGYMHGKCHSCVSRHGSPFGVVSIVGWREMWGRFLKHVTIDDADLSDAHRAVLREYRAAAEPLTLSK